MRRFLLLPLVVAAAILLALWARMPPSPAPVSAAGFDLAKAQAVVGDLSQAPHPSGSAENARVRASLIARLQSFGLTVSTQPTVGVRQAARRGGAINISPLENIIAVLPGRDASKKAVLLMAHYDSVPWSNGAADDGAGVAALVESARVLAAGPRPLRDVIILITDAEEYGMIGAQSFFDLHPLRSKVGAVINVEARGSRGRAFMFQTSTGSAALVDLWAKSVASPTGNSMAGDVYQRLPNDTDLTVPLAKGIMGINAAFIDALYDYHMPTDSAANLDPAALAHLGDFALSTGAALANADPLPTRGADSAYFDFFGLFVIRYPLWIGWGLVIAGAAVLVGSRFWLLGISLRQAIGGAFGALLLAAVVGAVCHLLGNALYGSGTYELRDRINEMGPALWMFIALVSGLTLIVRPGRKMWVGAVIALLLVAAVAQIWLPGANWLFGWAALIGAFLLMVAVRQGFGSARAIYTSAVVGGLWGAMLLFAVITTYVSVAPMSAAPLLLLSPFAIALLGPVLIEFGGKAQRWTGLGLLALTAVGAFWLSGTDRFSPRMPQVADLFHLSDLNSSKSWWATTSDARYLPGKAGASFSPKGFAGVKLQVTPAPAIAVPQPDIDIIQSGSRVNVTLGSAPAPRHLAFVITPSVALSDATVNGRPVRLPADTPTRIAWRAETPNAQIKLEFDHSGPGKLDVDWLYALAGTPPGAPPAQGISADWALLNGSRAVSGSRHLTW